MLNCTLGGVSRNECTNYISVILLVFKITISTNEVVVEGPPLPNWHLLCHKQQQRLLYSTSSCFTAPASHYTTWAVLEQFNGVPRDPQRRKGELSENQRIHQWTGSMKYNFQRGTELVAPLSWASDIYPGFAPPVDESFCPRGSQRLLPLQWLHGQESLLQQSRAGAKYRTTLTKVTLKAARQWKINFPLFPPQQLDGTFNLHEWKEDEIDFAENCWGYSLLSLNSLRVQMLIKCDHHPWVK